MQETMKLYLLFTFVTFLSASLGAHQERPRQDDSGIGPFGPFIWSVLNFNGGCMSDGCMMEFNMINGETDTEPGVTAQCKVNGDDLFWQKCSELPDNTEMANGSVWALPSISDDDYIITIQHRFVNYSLTPYRHWNITGNISMDFENTRLPENLTVKALSVSESWSWGS
ncbi:hypothetical protein VP1G_01231 [Cytospora mali]|uniref:Uncharacterized protein n=1 Tax=Cytospora mali TaxID=578113 RepID=A0A194UQE0_CYTMA|nr:hypothetical protein VP1G_01231 [Valsa mali var. pyri (nom. inval.)]